MSMRAIVARSLQEFSDDAEVRIVVLTGTPPAFCAGVDLTEAASEIHLLAGAPPSVSAPIAAFRKPIIAAVDGAAAGGGFEIALACDFIVSSSNAKFLLPEVRIGSLPGGGGTQRLVRAMPRGVAARMLYTGDSMDALTAFQQGLVTEVVEPEVLERHSIELADRIAANAPLSLLALKQCLKESVNASLDTGLALERSLWGQLSTTDDRAEGRAAFRESRPPEFRGK
jgi:enoyl-CoA hydratase/carnithine racemase